MYLLCHISTCIHHRYTRVPHPEPSFLLPPRTIPLGCPRAPAPNLLYLMGRPWHKYQLKWEGFSFFITGEFHDYYYSASKRKYNKMLGVITITTENRYNAVKVILMYWSGNLLFYASLWHCPLIGIEMKNDIFQSCGHCWVFQYCWHIECGTLKTSLSLLAILWNPAFRWVCLSFSPLPFATLLFSVTCKASSDKPFWISFSWGWLWLIAPVQSYEPPFTVLLALCV